MNGRMSLLVYPAKDMASAKTLFKALLGVEPYADMSYYAGFRTGGLEIGLDPNGSSAGPIAYWEVEDIGASLRLLVDAGGQTVQDVTDVGAGLLIATVKDAAGNTLGLRQPPR
jgi:predicted enzyme related to lactoylglutathione lyase